MTVLIYFEVSDLELSGATKIMFFLFLNLLSWFTEILLIVKIFSGCGVLIIFSNVESITELKA
jgi:hypothetical protein